MHVLPYNKADINNTEWGQLTWFASKALENSDDMTVGRCIIKPGKANPMHSHPNCSEVLVVLKGQIAHTFDSGEDVVLNEWDSISIPAGSEHRARNLGNEDAVLLICFSSAERETENE